MGLAPKLPKPYEQGLSPQSNRSAKAIRHARRNSAEAQRYTEENLTQNECMYCS